MIKIIQQTYKEDATFIFHRTRHTHSEIYSNAIRAQNRYLNIVRVVPIVGITRSEMFYLSNELLQDDGIKMVLEHSKTDEMGRYNVITDVNNFSEVSKRISTNIEQITQQIRQKYNLKQNELFPPVSVSFRDFNDDESSSDTMQSYLSACSSKFSDIEAGDDLPPESSLVPIQAWTKSTTTQQTSSTFSSLTASNNGEKFLQMEEENKQLVNRVNELSQQVQMLLAQKNTNKPSPMNVSVEQPQVVDLRQVPQPSIDYLIDKVMERFQTRTEEDLEMQDTPIPSILDTSFDSELTPNPK